VNFLLLDTKCPILCIVLDMAYNLFGIVVIDSYRNSSRMSLVSGKKIGKVACLWSLVSGKRIWDIVFSPPRRINIVFASLRGIESKKIYPQITRIDADYSSRKGAMKSQRAGGRGQKRKENENVFDAMNRIYGIGFIRHFLGIPKVVKRIESEFDFHEIKE
jgi:hypothetical protein